MALVLGLVANNLAHSPATPPRSSSTAPAATATAIAAPAPGDRQITVPTLTGLSGAQASSALHSAGALNVRFVQNGTSVTTGKVVGQDPAPGTTQRAGNPVSITLEEPPPPPPPAPPKEISSRDWQLIARNPDAHGGERIVVYGYVTQFDSATGTDTFRANVDGARHSEWYDYDTNTVLTGTPLVLGDLVKDDIFRAEVDVSGSLSYDTTMGGSTTVPKLQVTKIEVIGTTS